MARKCVLSGKGVLTGNNRSHAENKTRRRFLPNLQVVSMFSDALGDTIRIRLSTRSIKTVESKGGIDAYLLGIASTKLGDEARRIKRRIVKAMEAKAA
ncbi:MAG: 50S ribosomal protein L28 [Magnetospirillum sp. WYHS-4]